LTAHKLKKDLTIVCVAYKRYAQIPVLIHSFLCQSLQNWKLHIIHDGYDQEMDAVLRPYCDRHREITYEFTETRYNDFGHTLREIGIQKADTEYILITNDDNYYVPEFLKLMFNEISMHNLDMVLCDMVHSKINVTDGQMYYLKDQYHYFRTYPKKFMIDIGCFIVRTELAKKAGFRDKSFTGDGTFVEDIISISDKPIRVGKLEKILFVHN
jgi:hypothetical protein